MIRGYEEEYSTKRVPSYTDRILWKSLPGHAPNLDLLGFSSFPEVSRGEFFDEEDRGRGGSFVLMRVYRNIRALTAGGEAKGMGVKFATSSEFPTKFSSVFRQIFIFLPEM